VPAPHVHHTHPDAINVLAGEADGERLVRECFGDAAAWIPYIRPGFTLSRQVGEVVRANPALELVVLAKHGLVAWGDSAEQAYHRTIHATNTAARFVNARTRGTQRFGGPATTAVAVGSEEARASLLHGLLPGIRGALSSERAKLLTVDTSPRTVELASSAEAEALVSVGAPCPDHLAHTKRVPLWIPYDPGADDAHALRERITERAEAYRHEYRAYVQRHADASVVPGDPDARVVLIQHLGMVTAGTTVKAARLSRDLYHRAIEVMAGAHALGEFVSLSAQESFAIEYWPLVLYKLSLAPPPGQLQGQVAFVARAAGEIGKAIAERLAAAGACVVGFDLDADETAEALAGLGDSALAVGGDVTDQASVRAAFAAAIGRFGGVDVVVSDAASITHFASVVRSEESTGVLLEVAGVRRSSIRLRRRSRRARRPFRSIRRFPSQPSSRSGSRGCAGRRRRIARKRRGDRLISWWRDWSGAPQTTGR
jgi:rhamnose utilization protein RhaD (predicted bifunctional aldolase and dehydrogenase)